MINNCCYEFKLKNSAQGIYFDIRYNYADLLLLLYG